MGTVLVIALVTLSAMVVSLAFAFKLLWDWMAEREKQEKLSEKAELLGSMEMLDRAFRAKHPVPPRPTMPKPPQRKP